MPHGRLERSYGRARRECARWLRPLGRRVRCRDRARLDGARSLLPHDRPAPQSDRLPLDFVRRLPLDDLAKLGSDRRLRLAERVRIGRGLLQPAPCFAKPWTVPSRLAACRRRPAARPLHLAVRRFDHGDRQLGLADRQLGHADRRPRHVARRFHLARRRLHLAGRRPRPGLCWLRLAGLPPRLALSRPERKAPLLGFAVASTSAAPRQDSLL